MKKFALHRVSAPLLLLLLVACKKEGTALASQPHEVPPALTGDATLEGVVRLSERIPKPAAIPAPDSVRRVCPVEDPAPALEVDEALGLKNAVVSLLLPEGARVPSAERVLPSDVLDQKGCRYEPPVLAATVGAHLRVKNSDPLVHSVDAVLGGRPVFNFAMPLENMEVRRELPATPGLIRIRCDVHPWMSSTLLTFAHPYFAVTDAHGHFSLAHLPAGVRRLRVFHPNAAATTVEVSLPEHGAAAPVTVSLHAEGVLEPGQK